MLCAGLVGGAACASSGTSPTGDAGSGPGRIFISTTTISNQANKIFFATATNVSRLCSSITSNSFALTATAMTNTPDAGDNPCDPTVTPETVFDAGPTTITIGIFVGGQQTPEKYVVRTVTVAGDVTENIDGALLSP